jgi:hypothetical protein
MARMQTRRGFLGCIAAAGATSLIRTRWAEAAEGPLETTTVRFQKPGLCVVSSLYMAEELLRAEGFTDIRYVDAPPTATGPVANGDVDFDPDYASNFVRAIDAGEPITVLGGVMVRVLRIVRERKRSQYLGSQGQERRSASSGVEPSRAVDPPGRPSRARPSQGSTLGHRPEGQAERAVRTGQD